MVYQGEDCGGCVENGRKRLAYFHGYRDAKNEWQVDPEDKANARLIAAAPQMLDCLHGVLDQLEIWGGSGDGPLAEDVRAAIRKAMGEA